MLNSSVTCRIPRIKVITFLKDTLKSFSHPTVQTFLPRLFPLTDNAILTLLLFLLVSHMQILLSARSRHILKLTVDGTCSPALRHYLWARVARIWSEHNLLLLMYLRSEFHSKMYSSRKD